MSGPVVVGAGWIGRALSTSLQTQAMARRGFDPGHEFPPGTPVIVASGRASIPGDARLAAALNEELIHLRQVLDAADRSRSSRVVVLGSSDVAGMAEVIDGTTAQDPRTTYAEVKAALEDECVLRHNGGSPVTYVRLAPVHGPGKARTQALLRLARLPLIPLPNGGTHSTGFILLADAVRAIEWLAVNDDGGAPVQSVGAGPTPVGTLIGKLARSQGHRARILPIPVPAQAATRLFGNRGSDWIQWGLRLACPRSVLMDPPLDPTPLAEAAQMLVSTC